MRSLIQSEVARMSNAAGFRVSHDGSKPYRQYYSPQWCPDLTLLHGSHAGTHNLIDVTTASVVATNVLPIAARVPLVVADQAESSKRNKYGPVAPHVLLPFVVEHAGALGKEATEHFRRCKKESMVSEESFRVAL